MTVFFSSSPYLVSPKISPHAHANTFHPCVKIILPPLNPFSWAPFARKDEPNLGFPVDISHVLAISHNLGGM
jgi:hypothetical protein